MNYPDFASFDKSKTIDIKDLNSHIVSNLDPSPNTITIYHFIIGSKTEQNTLDGLDRFGKRNHECPNFVENLLFNPEAQFSPHLINGFSNYKEITIRQVLILIDPVYNIRPEPLGLLSIISHLGKDLTVRHIIEHNHVNHTSIISKLEPVLVPNDITEEHLLEMIKTIKSLSHFYPMIVNIMDCSSNVANKMFCDSIDNNVSWVYITQPKCLINDKKSIYMPMITLDEIDEDNGDDGDDCDIGVSVECKTKEIELFTNVNNKLNIRWVNYNIDVKHIDDLKTIYDVCLYSRNLYNFIINLYKVNSIEYSLYSIYKLWTYTTYTIDYQFDGSISGVCSAANKSITVNLSKINFEDFARYWKLYKTFTELPPFNYEYDRLIIHKFIDYFCNKYTNKTDISYLGIAPSIVDFIKLETFEIFKILVEYFPENTKYMVHSPEGFQRHTIINYLTDNGVLF
jgi:hypothetical protein